MSDFLSAMRAVERAEVTIAGSLSERVPVAGTGLVVPVVTRVGAEGLPPAGPMRVRFDVVGAAMVTIAFDDGQNPLPLGPGDFLELTPGGRTTPAEWAESLRRLRACGLLREATR